MWKECQFDGLPRMIENAHTLNGIERAGPKHHERCQWDSPGGHGPRPVCG
jgi:hypothetical protein